MKEKCLSVHGFPPFLSLFLLSQLFKLNKDGDQLGKGERAGGMIKGGKRRTECKGWNPRRADEKGRISEPGLNIYCQ